MDKTPKDWNIVNTFQKFLLPSGITDGDAYRRKHMHVYILYIRRNTRKYIKESKVGLVMVVDVTSGVSAVHGERRWREETRHA